MTEIQPPAYTAATATPPDVFRRVMASLATEGVVDAGSLAVTPETGMSVSVSAGAAFVLGDERPGQGMYHVWNDAPVTLTLDASDLSQARIDTVIARVYDDDEDSSGDSEWTLEVLKGMLGGSAPAVPDTAVGLAHIQVDAGATSIASGKITDLRGVGLGLDARQYVNIPPGAFEAPSTLGGPWTVWPNHPVNIAIPAGAVVAHVDITFYAVKSGTGALTFEFRPNLDGMDPAQVTRPGSLTNGGGQLIRMSGSFFVGFIAGTTVQLKPMARLTARSGGVSGNDLAVGTGMLVTYDVRFQ